MKVKLSKYYRNKGRKNEVEIHNYDVWSLDHSLAYIIYPALLTLKQTKKGIPADFIDNIGGEEWTAQLSFDFYRETHNWAFEQAVQRWEDTLDKMIWSFGELISDNENDYHYGKISKFKVVKTGKTMLNPITNKVEELSEMIDPDPNTHYFDADGFVLYQDRIQEGLELFGKYYRSLWD